MHDSSLAEVGYSRCTGPAKMALTQGLPLRRRGGFPTDAGGGQLTGSRSGAAAGVGSRRAGVAAAATGTERRSGAGLWRQRRIEWATALCFWALFYRVMVKFTISQ
jgi:hypothetical protein